MKEVIGLSEIDFRTIGDGKSGKVAKYEGWCEYVDESQAVKIPAKESASAG